MKKTIFISAVTLIISGCGSQYPDHNFAQSPTQPHQPNPINVKIPTRDYGSKSVEEIKRDLAHPQAKKQVASKAPAAHVQPPPPMKTLAPKPVVKKAPTATAEVAAKKPQPEKPVAKNIPAAKIDVAKKPQVEKPVAKIEPPAEKNKPTVKKEVATTEKPKVEDKKSKSVAEIKQSLKQPETTVKNRTTPQAKTTTPQVAAKDVAKEKPDPKKKSDKTVVVIQPSSKNGKPKAALKITNARSQIVASGKKLIGTPYLFGGTTRSGFDCSGLVQYVYKQHGINVPRTSRHQFSELQSVKQPQPGDLVFFRHGNRPVNHVGIYVGDNKMLHAPSTGKKVKIVDITTKYWKKRYAGARRVLDNNHLK